MPPIITGINLQHLKMTYESWSLKGTLDKILRYDLGQSTEEFICISSHSYNNIFDL